MNRVDLEELQVYIGKPSLSIFISCTQEHQKVDKVNRMFEKAIHQIKKEYGADDLMGFITEPHIIQSQLDLDDRCQGVAIFINKHVARAYALPFAIADEIIIDSSFAVSRVKNLLNRTERFWLLVMTHHAPCLFEGYENAVVEVVHRHSTWQGEELMEAQDLGGLVCSLNEQVGPQCRYASAQEFVQALDGYLKHFIESDRMPLVLLASRLDGDVFKQYSRYGHCTIATSTLIALLYPAQMARVTWPLAHKHFEHMKKERYQAIEEANKAGLCLTDVQKIWIAAREDRIKRLCFERQLQYLGCEDNAQQHIKQGSSCGKLNPVDFVDEIIELALDRAIPVTLYDQGELEKFGGIAAIVGD